VNQFSIAANAPLLPLDLWLPATRMPRGVPARLLACLTTERLLTECIQELSGAPAALRLIDQRLGFLGRDQQELLAAPAASCLLREVALSAGDRAWVFAQSLIPDHALELHPWLAELGGASLGASLAAFAGLERGPFEFAPLPASHPLAARAIDCCGQQASVLWARRSWFGLNGRRLLVQEVFLPEVERC
jgi:chorismate lyase